MFLVLSLLIEFLGYSDGSARHDKRLDETHCVNARGKARYRLDIVVYEIFSSGAGSIITFK